MRGRGILAGCAALAAAAVAAPASADQLICVTVSVTTPAGTVPTGPTCQAEPLPPPSTDHPISVPLGPVEVDVDYFGP